MDLWLISVASQGRSPESGRRSNALVEKELRHRGIKGIVPAHGAVLAFLLREAKPVPIKAVVENVRRVKSTVTVMIDTLEKHGYIRRLPCDTDSRVTYVELTPKGRRLQKDFEEISQILLSKALWRHERKGSGTSGQAVGSHRGQSGQVVFFAHSSWANY